MKIKNIFLQMFCLVFVMVLTFASASCSMLEGNPNDGNGTTTPPPEVSASYLVIQSDKTTALRGDVITLSSVIRTEGKEDVEVPADDVVYQLVEGDEFATLAGNTITVSSTATDSSAIKVKSIVGTTESTLLEIKVSVPLETINISVEGNPSSVKNGASVILEKELLPDGANTTGFEWEITSGNDCCKINGDVLIVNEDAPVGTIIKIKAVCGEVESTSEISLMVGIPLENISIELQGSLNVDPGKSRPITVVLAPANATLQTASWEFTQGQEYCYIINNTLHVNEDAPVGLQISFYAKIGDITSHPINVTVGTPITNLVISTETTEIVKGNATLINVTVEPQTATGAYSWVITQDGDYATVNNDWLSIKSSALTGATIKAKAVSGDVSSNEITFTILPTQEEINATKYYLMLDKDTVTVDARGNAATILTATLYNFNRVEVTDKDISFMIDDGADYVTVVDNGNYCTLNAIGHGKATVNVSVDGIEVESLTVSVNAVVPPDAITLPEVFAERMNFDYSFSMNKYSYYGERLTPAGKDSLPFVATAMITETNSKPCLDVKYSFVHEDGTYGDEVAIWGNDKITFNKIGKVTVTATSNSGSAKETSISYTFNINEGFNVYSFEEASTLLRKSYYNGDEVNFVALDILIDGDGNEYKYKFVSEVALMATADQTISLVANSSYNRIIAANKNLHINGNRHTVDQSHLRLYGVEDVLKYKQEKNSTWEMHGGIVSAEPWSSDPDEKLSGDYYARIYDLEVIGNTPVSYGEDVENYDGRFVCGYKGGIIIGSDLHDDGDYTIDFKNVKSSMAKDGFRFYNVVGGTVENVKVDNVCQNGIYLRSSIVTIRNTTIGQCGAVGIELAPEDSSKAGEDNETNQSVTFDGIIDVTGNIQPPNTPYLKAYMQGQVPAIIQGSLSFNGLNETQASHIIKKVNENDTSNSLCLVAFMLINTNTYEMNFSEVSYPLYQSSGIIDATKLPKDTIDTEHQFISLTVYMGKDMPLGKALMYNLNYIAK